MVLRSQATISALLILASAPAIPLAAGEPFEFQVRHRHLRGGSDGSLRVTDEGISFEEAGKHKEHSRGWRYEDIRQLTLSGDVLQILTYDNRRWRLGDQEYQFDQLSKDLAGKLDAILSRRLDQRFVAALADAPVKPAWEVGAKLLHWRSGPQGTLIVGADRVVFQTESPEDSRTWRIRDIDVVSSSGPFDLTITTFEHSGGNYAGHKDFHFALKRPIADVEYNALWGRVNQAKGLQILNYEPKGEKQ